jgi:hypothetical protein
MVLPMSPNTCYPSLRSVHGERDRVRGDFKEKMNN